MQSMISVPLCVLSFCGLAIAAAGADGEETPRAAAAAALQTGSPQMELMLSSPEGPRRLHPDLAGTWELPPAAYSARSITLKATEKTAEAEVNWTLHCARKFGKLARFTIKDGETLAIPAGAPLLAKATVRRAGEVVSIGTAIVGRAGEEYEPGARRNGKPQAAPKLEIVDETGNILASGKFEYG